MDMVVLASLQQAVDKPLQVIMVLHFVGTILQGSQSDKQPHFSTMPAVYCRYQNAFLMGFMLCFDICSKTINEPILQLVLL